MYGMSERCTRMWRFTCVIEKVQAGMNSHRQDARNVLLLMMRYINVCVRARVCVCVCVCRAMARRGIHQAYNH
jgi:hypothetical protein